METIFYGPRVPVCIEQKRNCKSVTLTKPTLTNTCLHQMLTLGLPWAFPNFPWTSLDLDC